MRVWLKALAIFAVLAAAPFIIEVFLGRNPLFSSGRHGGPKPCCAKPLGGEFPWDSVLNWGGLALLVLLVVALIGAFIYSLTQAYEVSEKLTLAERELTALLRGWGGGLSKPTREDMAKERAGWLGQIKRPEAYDELYKQFYEKSETDLGGGAQGAAMGKARITAFLLREVYEGNVVNAQRKIYNEYVTGGKKLPHIVAGLREILDFDNFNPEMPILNRAPAKYAGPGFPRGSGTPWQILALATLIYRHPRHIVMVQNNAEIKNWEVLNLLNRQAPPSPPKP
jgi:hypothetical protein